MDSLCHNQTDLRCNADHTDAEADEFGPGEVAGMGYEPGKKALADRRDCEPGLPCPSCLLEDRNSGRQMLRMERQVLAFRTYPCLRNTILVTIQISNKAKSDNQTSSSAHWTPTAHSTGINQLSN
jgi:hypothetical protein